MLMQEPRTLKISFHARHRWQERFPQMDLLVEFNKARRPGRETMKWVKASCSGHWCSDGDFAYLRGIRRCRAVFVIATDTWTLVTVLDRKQK